MVMGPPSVTRIKTDPEVIKEHRLHPVVLRRTHKGDKVTHQIDISEEVVKEAHNFDMDNIYTPVNVEAYTKLLKASNYNPERSAELVDGFTNGFDLGYRGPLTRKNESKNLRLRVGTHTELWNKVIQEVQAKRFCGPFRQPPFDNYVQSPLGECIKKKKKKFLAY